MGVETIHTLVVGGGQAGLAMSAHLGRRKIPHLLLERHRIAERWRTERWDSLVANGPAWHDRFPDLGFDDMPGDAFAPRDRIVRYFEDYAAQIDAPLRCGVEVSSAERIRNDTAWRIETSEGTIVADALVCATGPFQKPLVPGLVPSDAGVTQIHSTAYRNPGALPEGAVLVVGAGSSGSQIADELLRSGRRVFLSVGPHDRPPIRYRGRDFCWWLGVLGLWDAPARAPGMEHVTIAVSGAHGGITVDFRRFAARGMTLLGRVEGCRDGVLNLAGDLRANVAAGDRYLLALLDQADAHVAANGLDLPPEPEARRIEPDPPSITDPLRHLDLSAEGIAAIVWATGFTSDYGWLKAGPFDARGTPVHRHGISPLPGLYVLGLPWLTRRASPFIWGVWSDAQRLAEVIDQRRGPSADPPLLAAHA